MSGSALAVTTGIAAGVVLLGTAAGPGPDQYEGTVTMDQADTPTTGFRRFFNPATGEWIEYTAIAADNHGQLVACSVT